MEHLQEAALLGRVHVGPQDPLVLGLFLVTRAQLDLVQLQLKARAALLQLDFAAGLFEDVVAERDEVVVVGERDGALGIGLGHGEEVLEDVGDALALCEIESEKLYGDIEPLTRSAGRTSAVSKLLRIMCGYASDTLARSSMSWRRTAFESEKYAVGPYGMWHTTSPSRRIGFQREAPFSSIRSTHHSSAYLARLASR
jgi:hypothetical protein